MLSQLPPVEHDAVIASLRAIATADKCTCNEAKVFANYPFCQACCNELRRAGFDRDLSYIYWSLRQDGREFQWLRMEQCMDALRALRSGTWNGKKARREHDE